MEKCAALPAPTGPSALPGPNDCATAGVRNARSVAVQRLWRRRSDQQLGGSLSICAADGSPSWAPSANRHPRRDGSPRSGTCSVPTATTGLHPRSRDGRVVLAATDDSTPRLMRSTPAQTSKSGDRTREPHRRFRTVWNEARSFSPKIAPGGERRRKVAVAATQRSAHGPWPRPWPFFTHHERNST